MPPLLALLALVGASAAGEPVPAGQRCRVDLVVVEGQATTGWRVATAGDAALLVTTTRGSPQAVLRRGDDTWFQTGAMRAPMRVDPSQPVGARVVLGDLLDPAAVARLVPIGAEGTVRVTPEGKASWASAELTVRGGVPQSARFYGPSGRLSREAAWTWSGATLTRLLVTDAAGAHAEVTLGAPACAPGRVDATPETLLGAAKALAAEVP